MRILSMTATFGCLEEQTLTFTPGLNIIHAPNEWGKSTWCAFLMAMLYGIDTRQRAKQGQLADKTHYQPWSGKPMGGSMDILWEGRAITIERTTQGRIPMGAFRAYETQSGLDIPELTGENCGMKLLGVERGVYARSGFISAGSMAVTQDDDLLRRLNRLVTTGDDHPQMVALEGKLRELKHKCRYHQTGALPQVMQELEQCRKNLERQQDLERQARLLRQELTRQQQWQQKLRQHADALRSRSDREKLTQLETAKQNEAEAARSVQVAAEQCRGLPSMAMTAMGLDARKELHRQQQALALERVIFPCVGSPEPPQCFLGLTPEQAMEKAESHLSRLRALQSEAKKGGGLLLLIPGLAMLVAGLVGLFSQPGQIWWRLLIGVLGLTLAIVGSVRQKGKRRALRNLQQWQERMAESYGGEDPMALAKDYRDKTLEAAERENLRKQHFEDRQSALDAREQELDAESLHRAQDAWTLWADAQRSYIRARGQRRALETMLSGQTLSTRELTSDLTLNPGETKTELEKAEIACAGLSSRLDSCMGQLRALPGVEELNLQKQTLEERMQTLAQWYDATTKALELLTQANQELRRRFAPRISKEAGAILYGLTGGRYQKLLLDADFSLLTRGERENTVRESIWRSMGTQEQLYLAVRLAICRVMLPSAPVVLDDALSHFDDERMAAALNTLQSGQEQVVLFSCQSREQTWLERQN